MKRARPSSTDAERGRPTTITIEQYRRIVEVRRLRESTPTDKELARELGLSVHTIGNAMRGRGIRRYELALRQESPR